MAQQDEIGASDEELIVTDPSELKGTPIEKWGEAEPATTGTGDPLPVTIIEDAPVPLDKPIEAESINSVVETEFTKNDVIQPVEKASVVALSGKPVKKRRTGLVVALVSLGVLLLLSGGTAAAYQFWYQNPEKVVGDALISAITARSVNMAGVINYGQGEGPDVKITIDGGNTSEAADYTATISFTYDGNKFEIQGALIYTSDGSMYIKVEGVEDYLRSVFGDYANQLLQTEYIQQLINQIDSKWIKIESSDLAEFNDSADTAAACVQDLMKKVKTDSSYISEVSDAYSKSSFFVVSESMGTESVNGVQSFKFAVDVDSQKLQSFSDEFNKLKLYKELKSCDAESFNDIKTIFDSSADDIDTSKAGIKMNLWVGVLGHEITRLSIEDTEEDSSVSTLIEPDFNQQLVVSAPKDSITFDELNDEIQRIMDDFQNSLYDDEFYIGRDELGTTTLVEPDIDISTL